MEWGLRHHSEIYAGCQKFASEANWETSIIPSSHKALETQSYDGIIARTGNRLHDTALKNGIPLVNVWQNFPAKEAVSVFTNTEKAGAMATEHLIGRGLQRFGYMGYYRDIAAVKHLKGFKKTLQQNGFDCSAFQFHRTSIEGKSAGWEKFTSDLKDWVKSLHFPVGINTITDICCRYFIETCNNLRLQIPHDLAIVGTGNEPLICNSPSPSLTSIDQNYEYVGYRAVQTQDLMIPGRGRCRSFNFVNPWELSLGNHPIHLHPTTL